jgi:hypothetical protein
MGKEYLQLVAINQSILQNPSTQSLSIAYKPAWLSLLCNLLLLKIGRLELSITEKYNRSGMAPDTGIIKSRLIYGASH